MNVEIKPWMFILLVLVFGAILFLGYQIKSITLSLKGLEVQLDPKTTVSFNMGEGGEPSHRSNPVIINNTEYPTWKYCSNTRLSVIQVGDFAYVNPEPPMRNRLRKSPDARSTILTMIPYRDRYRMEIQNGPECADGWIWWQVKYTDSNAKTWYGWTAEGDDFWLLPILEER